ncbi:23S rRNA (uracil(1939)-C(5))-methyltransferase RlmD [uncultured Ruminococcus sp.]|uniref:23S rRNA (uracil(1939)-C(5))-methyltransferase RlmD n=1 Tax=uncultured Ruminococcus sp. TaxID=165186 RepID=UPI0025E2B1FC|nr:23S rRNA (uracil(1939)-C(5))-methyltransferase RlmD [uncultured Ruminococcus sp.]
MKRASVMNKHTIINKSTGEKKCSCFKRCGGCQLDKPYAEQIEWKQAKEDRMLSRFCRPKQIIAMSDPYNYRNKVQTVYKVNGSRHIVSGVYQSSKHSVVLTDDCFLEDIRAQQIIATLKDLMADFRILPYNEESGQGLLKHTLIRTSQTTGEVMLVLVTASPVFPAKKNFVHAITEKHPYITTIVQNINKGTTPLTLGDRDIIMYGKGYITDELCGCRFRVSPHSFYQVNPEQTEKLYAQAISCAELKKGDKVIDAYCGTGTIGLIAAKSGADVAGVELNAEAVKDAVSNAKLNKLDNIRFYNEDAGEFMTKLADAGESCDTVFLDPPRAGTTEEFVDSLGKLRPEKIVYVSCKIETLERDLKLLAKIGYKAQLIQPVDMFPHTTGIENVVLLKRKVISLTPNRKLVKKEDNKIERKGKNSHR